jgi:hypothetical protein
MTRAKSYRDAGFFHSSSVRKVSAVRTAEEVDSDVGGTKEDVFELERVRCRARSRLVRG